MDCWHGLLGSKGQLKSAIRISRTFGIVEKLFKVAIFIV